MEANLALALDDREWQDAQQADAKEANGLLTQMQHGFSDGNAVSAAPQADSLADQLAEMRQLIENMKASQQTVSATGGQSLLDAENDREVWEINPKEIMFDREVDDDGERVKVKIGSGAFCDIFRGSYRRQPVAIKTYQFHSDKDREAFATEASVMSRLSHLNIGFFLFCFIYKYSGPEAIIMLVSSCFFGGNVKRKVW